MDEYGDFQYDDYALIQEEYKYEESKKTPQQYYQVSLSGGLPILAATSIKEHEAYSGPKEKLYFNFSGSLQLPYYPIGALDISPGMRFMTFGWQNSYNGQWKCLQLATFASIDFKPIFYFLPKGIHTSLDVGLSYNMAFDSDQDSSGYFGSTVQPALPGQEYGGVGFNIGGSLDYWLDELPIAVRLYGQSYFIPQAPPFPELKTMFGSIGLSVVVVLKRH